MVRIMADSTCDLSRELIQKYNITIIPLHILLGDKEYEDGKTITPEEIYEWADGNKTTPKTSAPSIDAVIEAYKPILEAGDEIVLFTISESMSTAANVCRLAASELDAEDKVTVINSENLSTGIGLLVIESAILASAGETKENIEKVIQEYIPKVRASFVVDTLVYLHRGGRCSGLSALLGSAIKLHPRIVVENGSMHSDKKYRGNMKNVILSYVKDLTEDMKAAKKDRVFITHSGTDAAIVEEVRKYLEELSIFDEIIETRAGGVISSHCGPGTLGVLFIANEC